MDTAPESVRETTDPDKAIAWLRSLPLYNHTAKALLCEWAKRNHVKLTKAHYDQIGFPMKEMINANMSKLPRA